MTNPNTIGKKNTTVAIYGLGGAGCRNVHSILDNCGEGKLFDCAYFIDSASDTGTILPGCTDANTYLVPGGRGGAKHRDQYAEYFQAKGADILKKFPFQDINIFQTSATGGTGATAMHFLTTALATANPNAAFLIQVILSQNSIAEINNALAMMRSLQSLVRSTKRSVLVQMASNGIGDVDRVAANYQLQTSAIEVATLARHSTLDPQDVKTWTNPSKTAGWKASPGVFQWHTGSGEVKSSFPIRSIITAEAADLEHSVNICNDTPFYTGQGVLLDVKFRNTETQDVESVKRLTAYVTGGEFAETFNTWNQLLADSTSAMKTSIDEIPLDDGDFIA